MAEVKIADDSFRCGFGTCQFHLPVPEFISAYRDSVAVPIPGRYLLLDQRVSIAILVLIGFAARVVSAAVPARNHLLLCLIKSRGSESA
jgi:hypothetical protein